jgi:AraC family transcriptional regulator
MSEVNVRIVTLDACRVAASYGFGSGPEEMAWTKLLTYVKLKGLASDGQQHRYLGFNNPSPTPGSPNYGYEQWVTVGPDAEAEDDVKIKDFTGGLYAVTRCRLRNITDAWQELARWREKSSYLSASHQWLEEIISSPLDSPIHEDMEFDLYLPIAK